MPTLSVVMIVKNEAACLGDCLASIRDIADEIVIGDTGSNDSTVAIAQAYNATLLDVPWHDDFAEARNTVLKVANGDWLLHLDADEVVDAESAPHIRALVDADGNGADAIEVTLANYCDDPRAWRWVPVAPDDARARGYAGYVRVGLLRLFRNGRGYAYREPVHENITESVRERSGIIRDEPILIHHYGFSPEGNRAAEKAALYLDIARRKTDLSPDDPKAWHDRAELEVAAGDAAAAEASCRRALVCEPLYLNAATTLANVLLNRGDILEARALFERLESAGISPPHVVTTLGAIACREGRLEEAKRRLEAVVSAQSTAIMARLYLARVLDRLEDKRGAQQQLESALTVSPSLAELRDRLKALQMRDEGEKHFQAGKIRDALAAFVSALRLDPEDPLLHNNLGVVLATLGQAERARESFKCALVLAPGLPDAAENLRALG